MGGFFKLKKAKIKPFKGNKGEIYIIQQRRNNDITDESEGGTYPIMIKNNLIIKNISRYLHTRKNAKQVNEAVQFFFNTISPPSASIQLNHLKASIRGSHDLKDIFDRVGGYVLFSRDPTKQKVQELIYGEKKFTGFCWIPDSTFEYLSKNLSPENINCIELDTSFAAAKPNVYCVVQLIYRNVTLPIALIVGPTECFELYNLFYRALKSYDDKHPQKKPNELTFFDKVIQIPILTDMHKSFDTLRNKYNMKHYYCYAHIIRSFGASSPISVFVREILYSNTQEQFERNLKQSKKKFNILLSLKSESTTPKNKKKFEDLCIKEDPTNEKTKIESDLRYSCLYQRILDKVPTTTNHAESFHSKVNDSLPARGKYAQYKGIGTVIETMQRSIFNVNVNLTRQTNEEMKKIKKEIKKKYKGNKTKRFTLGITTNL